MDYLPVLEIFMAVLGFGLTIMFCTTFCRACSRLRDEQIEREVWRRTEHDGRPPSIYVIPFPRSLSQDSEDMVTRPSLEYTNGAFCEPPPAYNELGFKPDDLPLLTQSTVCQCIQQQWSNHMASPSPKSSFNGRPVSLLPAPFCLLLCAMLL
ncbi:hypothetical protein WMY93_005268 [Mugilogobius chulae]|uniref:Uncharacterized protein n=1 Tax=Mugilogobius chulae TaxID=88201 RepID=A0AAW0PR07_9GOBI